MYSAVVMLLSLGYVTGLKHNPSLWGALRQELHLV